MLAKCSETPYHLVKLSWQESQMVRQINTSQRLSLNSAPVLRQSERSAASPRNRNLQQHRKASTVFPVGLGASNWVAGLYHGLLRPIPDKTGMAFVAIHHMRLTTRSIAVVGQTAKIAVALAVLWIKRRSRIRILLYRRTILRIENGTLYLTKNRQSGAGYALPIGFLAR
jgi:hypothetical protein